MSRILIVGGAGYIGSVLCRSLLSQGYFVTVYDSLLYGEASMRSLDCDRLNVIQADTRDMRALCRAFKHCDAVVYLGELVSDPICAKFPVETLEINHLAPVNAIRLARYLNVPRFIYMSTCSIYGMCKNSRDVLVDENSFPDPTSIYAKYKLLNEQEIFREDASQFIVLRLGTVFGPSPRQRLDLVANLFTAKGFFDKKFSVFGGSHWRACVHVEDVVLALQLALEAGTSACGQAYNILTENCTIADIANKVKNQVFGVDIEWLGDDNDVRDYRASCKRAEKFLGFKPEQNIDDTIATLLEKFESGYIADHNDSIYYNSRWYRGEGHSV